MTTQELVERLRVMAATKSHEAYNANPWEPPADMVADAVNLRAAASRLSEMEQERRDISMALGNQPDERVSAAELVENIERISRIAGKGVIRLSEMDAENKRLREALKSIELHTSVSSHPHCRDACADARAALEHQQKGETP